MLALAVAAGWFGPAPGGAATAPAPRVRAAEELKRLSLEELMELEVSAAGKRPERLADVAAAVSVITREDIRRSGVRTLPEALRLAAGVHVGRFDSRTWGVSARGFNLTTANKMLVMIDGRSVYTPLFSGVFWDVQNPLLEDVERIEVVRGPGGTLWGANAVNGVIHVVTRSAAATQGGFAEAGAGTEERLFGAFRWGGEVGRGHYRAYAKYDHRDGLVLVDGSNAGDPLRIAQGGFRTDFAFADGELALHGDAYQGVISHPFREDTDVDGANLVARWRRPLGDGSISVHGYYDHTFRRVPGQFQEDRDTWDLEAQHVLRHRRHDLVWGGGYRSSEDRVGNSEVIAWEPPRESSWVANLFFHDDLRLAEDWRLIVGTKLEQQSTMDLEVLPTVRLAWRPTGGQMLWGAISRAVRAPTRLDRDILAFAPDGRLVLRGSDDFQPEEVIAHELGYRLTRAASSLELAAFYNQYDQLRSQEPHPTLFFPVTLANRLEGETWGLEAEAGWEATRGLWLRAGAAWLRKDLRLEPGSADPTAGASEGSDPRFHSFLRADLDLARGVQLGLWLRQVDDLPEADVPGYVELDLRIAWEARPGVVLSLVGQNLLDEHHPEIGAPSAREEVQRGAYGHVGWRF